jgi:hypothetical protein
MKLFTRHPEEQGIDYLEHLHFAMGIACRLLCSVAAFALHGVFPFIGIRQDLDLEQTAIFIRDRNNWIERMKKQARTEPVATSPGILYFEDNGMS